MVKTEIAAQAVLMRAAAVSDTALVVNTSTAGRPSVTCITNQPSVHLKGSACTHIRTCQIQQLYQHKSTAVHDQSELLAPIDTCQNQPARRFCLHTFPNLPKLDQVSPATHLSEPVGKAEQPKGRCLHTSRKLQSRLLGGPTRALLAYLPEAIRPWDGSAQRACLHTCQTL